MNYKSHNVAGAARSGLRGPRPANRILQALLVLALMLGSVSFSVPAAFAQQAQQAPLYGLVIDLSGSTVNCTDRECLSVSAARMNLDLLRPARVVLVPFYGDQADIVGPFNLGNPAEFQAAHERLAAMCNLRNPNFQTPLAKALDAATDVFTRENAAPESRLLLFTDGEPTPGRPGGPGAQAQYDLIFI